MAPNDMLLIASCAPHTLPKIRSCFLVTNPPHRLTALLTWGCHKCCGSWGEGGVCLKARLQAQPEVWGSEGQI